MSARFNDRRWLWRGIERVMTAGGWPARAAAGLGFPSDVEVVHHEIEVNASPARTGRLRIAFASDFHAGPSTPPVIIDKAFERLAGLEADLLLFGGDFVCQRGEHASTLVDRLAALRAPLGKFAVLGNHDHWSGPDIVIRCLEEAGIDVLMNRCARLPAPFGHVSICGLDDHSSSQPDAEAAFAGSGPVRILLMHSPSGMLDVGDREFDVALCGHTHGGQVALPDGRPLKVAHGKLTRRYNAGRFDVGSNRTMIVSRGIGCSTFPVRVNAPPAILTCDLNWR